MSDHIEWGVATDAFPLLVIEEPGEVTDAYGTSNDKPALVFDTGSGAFVLEGTSDDLAAIGKRIVELATNYLGPEEPEPDDDEDEEADPWSVDPITPARGGH